LLGERNQDRIVNKGTISVVLGQFETWVEASSENQVFVETLGQHEEVSVAQTDLVNVSIHFNFWWFRNWLLCHITDAKLAITIWSESKHLSVGS
jgi:hypothetical protein